MPGPWLGRELGRLLRAGDHQRRFRSARTAFRAVPVGGPGRAARHRPGHRAPPPRGGDPVRLRQVRQGPGGPGGQRDLLPAADGAARRGPGAWLHPAAAGPVGQAGGAQAVRGGPADPARRGGPRAGHRARRADAAAAPAPRHPLRRDGDLRPAGRGGVPGGVGADAGPVGAAVGQGRLRLRGPGQVRPARPRHADRAAGLLRAGGGASRRALEPAHDPAGGPRRLRHAVRGGHGRGVPGRVAGPDGHPAPAAAEEVLRPGGGGRADQAGPDPGRLGAPLHAPPPRRRAAGHAARVHARRPGQDPRGSAVPGADDAARDRLRRVQPGRGGPAAPGDELQARPGADRGTAGADAGRDGGPGDPARTSPRTSTPRSWPSPATASPSRTRSASPTWSTPARG